ncbi:MAG: ORF6N domain-containing protein [Thermodesulfobacteriota bacterium]|nr:ORF6N domain-containing protein [Thermodesulfobacteriota bacterium]
MNEIIPIENITGLIYLIRGQRVMLDRDIAELYGVETKRLKEQVKRNIERFPEDFMFELSTKEYENLRSHFATSSWGGTRYMPMAFTEHGILMISSVLKNDKAVQVNIQIMRAFMKMRQMIFDNAELRKQIDELRADTDGKFRIVFETLDQLLFIENRPKKKIGFMAKEKQAEYGKGGNRKNERNAVR